MEQHSSNERKFGTDELKAAGASEAFVSVYLSAAEGRHSVRQELDSGYGGTVLEEGRDPTEVAGGFFTKLWNGRLFDAFLHADGSNTPLLLEVFGPAKIRNAGAAIEKYDIDYCTTMVNERADRYGYEALK